jgi:predicted AlkP superfamily phosphohydrolase/phosphomutase
VIGLDAMEWTLVSRWAAAGRLPTFQRLIRDGLRAELTSVADALPDAAWTTLSYGVNPGKLEKYFYVEYDGATSALRFTPDSVLRGTTFWEHLARAGKRIGVADVPHMPFRDVPGGFNVTGWGAHDAKVEFCTGPASLRAEIDAQHGRHPVGDCETFDQRDTDRLRKAIVTGTARHGALFRWLMQRFPWDVFVCAFSAPHCAGHHFWTGANGAGNTLEETYRAVDREVGEMIALAGPDTRVLLVAAHGMGPLVHASWHLSEILDRLGFGRPGSAARTSERARRGRVNPWRIAKMVVPSRLQYAIKNALPDALQAELLFLWYAGRRRYRGRTAFAVPNNEVVGAIRLAVAGRDRGGTIEPGEEYRRRCREIGAALEELVDPATGRRVVAKVTHLHDVYHGPYVDRLPDLTVLWDSSFYWDAVSSPRLGTLHVARQDGRVGSHTPTSFLLAIGPGVPPGALHGRSTLDVAPTILAAAGVAVPPEMDGRPLPFAS